jgi:hypothetical protein
MAQMAMDSPALMVINSESTPRDLLTISMATGLMAQSLTMRAMTPRHHQDFKATSLSSTKRNP